MKPCISPCLYPDNVKFHLISVQWAPSINNARCECVLLCISPWLCAEGTCLYVWHITAVPGFAQQLTLCCSRAAPTDGTVHGEHTAVISLYVPNTHKVPLHSSARGRWQGWFLFRQLISVCAVSFWINAADKTCPQPSVPKDLSRKPFLFLASGQEIAVWDRPHLQSVYSQRNALSPQSVLQ